MIDLRNLPAAQTALVDRAGRATTPYYDLLRRIVGEMSSVSSQLAELRALAEQLSGEIPDLSDYTRRNFNETIRGQWDFFRPLRAELGTAEFPSITWTADSRKGLFSAADDAIGISTDAVQRMEIGTTSIRGMLPFRGVDGSAADPSFGISSDDGNGIYLSGPDALGVSTGGVQRLDIGTATVKSLLQVEIESTAPRLLIDDTDAGTGQRMIQLDAAGLRTRSDADASRTDILAWTRDVAGNATGVQVGHSNITTALTFYGVSTTFRTAAGGVRHVAFDNTGFTVFGQKTMRVENTAGDDAIEMSCLTGDISYITTFLTDLYIGTSLALIVKQTGDVQIAADSIELQIGAAASGDLRLSHNGTNSIIRNDTGNLLFQAGATEVARISGSNARFQFADGTLSLPGIPFFNDADCGLRRVGTNNIAAVTGGVDAIDIDSGQRVGFARAAISGWRMVAAGAAGVGALLLEDTGVADSSRPFGWMRSNAGVLEIGNSNRSGSGTTGSTVRVSIDATGRLYGSALHNNSAAPTGTANQFVASGTYTPTLTNVANVAASTAYQCQWIRVGNVVTVSGKVDVDPTLTATVTQLAISLPIASNLANAEDCSGCAFSPGVAGQGAAVLGDTTNDRAQMQWLSGDVTNQAMYFCFTYEVL